MKRIKLIVAYEGTNYHGWQLQPNGITIEEVLNQNLSRLLNEKIVVIGASRTDSGVHALGNVAVFDTKTRIPAEKISYALNQGLPEDVVVQDSCEVPLDFHPRRRESVKTYEYRMLNRSFRLPSLRRDTYFYYRPLDLGKMQLAASFLEGEHDFTSFCSIHATHKNDSVRRLSSVRLMRHEGDVIALRLVGSGFLYNMVRIIAGTLIQVGIGELLPTDIPSILEKKDRSMAGPTAPAHGLTMIGIEFL